MPKFYKINDISPGLDGLIIEAGDEVTEGETTIVMVAKIIDRDSILGDRHVSYPVAQNALCLNREYLEETEDPGSMTYDSTNPFGKFVLEGRLNCGELEVAYAQYEKSMSVTVMNVIDDSSPTPAQKSMRTVYAENFSKRFDEIKELIEESMRDGDSAELLVFSLKQMKEEEKDGQA